MNYQGPKEMEMTIEHNRLRGIVEQMDRRLSHLESMSLWTLGILITTWLTLMLSIWVKK